MNDFSQEIVCDSLVFPECLRWRNGELWFVDMYDGRLLSVTSGEETKIHLSRETIFGGIGWLPDNKIVLCDKPTRLVIDADGKQHADLSQYHHAPINDLVALPDGSLFVGEYGFAVAKGEKFSKGNVYRVSPGGETNIAAYDLAFPNGMVVSSDGSKLFVAESYAQRISSFDISNDGQLSNRQTFVKFPKGGPDGISIDTNGNIWAAMVGPKAIIRVNPDGKMDREVILEEQPYDVEVGEHSDQLFVGTSHADLGDLDNESLPRTGKILKLEF